MQEIGVDVDCSEIRATQIEEQGGTAFFVAHADSDASPRLVG